MVFVQAGSNSNKNKHHQRYPPAYFTHTPTNVTRSIGQRAVLQCNVKNLGPRKVIWRKLPGTSPITVGTFTFEPDPNYKVQSDSNREQWDLIIENVQKRHAGTYECQIASSLGLAVTVNLTVLEPTDTILVRGRNTDKPPDNKRHEIHMAGTQYVDVGDTITLQCNATGVDYIPEDVDWFKDGNEIRPNPLTKIYITKYQSVSARSLHSELEIKHGQMSDAGTYICRISEMDIASLKVHVLNDPRKNNKSTGNRKRGTYGQSVKQSENGEQGYLGSGSTNRIISKTHGFLLWTCLFLAWMSHTHLKDL